MFTEFIGIVSSVNNEDQEHKIANTKLTREWDYFKELLSINPLNMERIYAYLHMV